MTPAEAQNFIDEMLQQEKYIRDLRKELADAIDFQKDLKKTYCKAQKMKATDLENKLAAFDIDEIELEKRFRIRE